jgi:hypothetical protein
MTRTVSEAIAQGMAAAEHLTSEERKDEMLEAIKAVARSRETFMADEIRDFFGGVGDERDNGSGLGPVMKQARLMGIIVKTGTLERSKRPPASRQAPSGLEGRLRATPSHAVNP